MVKIAPPVFGSPAPVPVTTDVICVTTVVGSCVGCTVNDGATYVVTGSAVITEVEGANVVVEP